MNPNNPSGPGKEQQLYPNPFNKQPLTQATSTSEQPSVMEGNNGLKDNDHKNSNMIILMAVMIVVVLAVAGGVFYYMSTQSLPTSEQVAATPRPSPTPDEAQKLESEMDQTDVDVDSQFKEVDADINSL